MTTKGKPVQNNHQPRPVEASVLDASSPPFERRSCTPIRRRCMPSRRMPAQR